MNLDALMARHARTLVRASRGGESVTWHFADGSPDRSFLAIVDRQLLEPLNTIGIPGAAALAARVWVPRGAAEGVETVSEGDQVSVVLRLGFPAARCRITSVVSEDAGGYLVQVQA